MLSKFLKFLNTDIWRMRLDDYPHPKSFLITQLRVIALAVRRFREDSCDFRASALTFFSLLSIVPVIAMMFGIAKGFGLEERVRLEILKRFQGQEEMAEKIVTFANSLLENAKGGLIAGIGVAILFWSVMKVLGNIEHSFNIIWGVKKPRSLTRKFSDYLSLILICPILMALAGSATVLVSSQANQLLEKITFLKSLGPLLLLPLKLLPYCTLWATFTFIFIFMPNTKVKLKSGLVAGILAGTLFQIVQLTYINLQIGAAKYSAIYGSFAALPLFLIWLQLSWLIILFGAEIAFAIQNVQTYEFEQDCLSVSHKYKNLLSLLITRLIVERFSSGKTPLNADSISHELGIPIRLVRQILFDLVESGVLSEVNKGQDSKESSFQPARDVNVLTIKYVIDALEERGNTEIPVVDSAELKKLTDNIASLSEIMEKAPNNVTLKSI
ncbi:MAG: YihY/virulence factor BrkB family protein [Sedimentisphaerales bacterium]|nr:YihY/virulence factor BrkB family protein [Sedimentisphaerales bacterium]